MKRRESESSFARFAPLAAGKRVTYMAFLVRLSTSHVTCMCFCVMAFSMRNGFFRLKKGGTATSFALWHLPSWAAAFFVFLPVLSNEIIIRAQQSKSRKQHIKQKSRNQILKSKSTPKNNYSKRKNLEIRSRNQNLQPKSTPKSKIYNQNQKINS